MKVTKLSAQNFKGWTGSQELAPVTVFHGRNWTGKSSRIEALVFALCGYLPKVGKKPGDLFARLSSGPSMSADVFFDNGTSTGVGIIKDGDSVKTREPNVRRLNMPAVMFDCAEFTGLSSAERVKFLFARAKLPESLKLESVRDTVVANVKNTRLEENSQFSEEVIEVVCGCIRADTSKTPQEFIESVSLSLNDKRRLSMQNVQRMEKTQAGLVQTATLEQVPADAQARRDAAAKAHGYLRDKVSKLEQRVDDLRRQWNDLNSKRGLPAGPGSEWSDEDERRLRAMVEECEGKLKQRPGWKPDLDMGRAAVNEYEQVAKLVDETEASLKKMDCCPTCNTKFNAKRKPKLGQKMVERRNQALNRISELHPKLAELTLYEKAAESLQAAQADLARGERVMRQIRDDREARQKQEQVEKDGAEAKRQLSELDAQLVGAKVLLDEAEEAYKQLTAQQAEERTRARAREEHARARVELEVLKQACAGVAELQAKLVEAAVQPVLDTANRLCGDILREPLAYRDGEVGYVGDAGFVTHRSMSGTEKALCYAALSVALAQDSPFKLVVLDEFDIDEDNMALLLSTLARMTLDGVVDQAVVAHTAMPKFELGALPPAVLLAVGLDRH